MKVIKRDGHVVDYYPEKIKNAIEKANMEVSEEDQVSSTQIKNIIKYIERLDKKRMLVEDIQDIIELKLMSIGKYALAKKYITYRYTRELVRKSNTTDLAIKELIDGESEYWNTENSNKNAKVVTTQRDYLAGITSTDITRRFLLPEDIVKAHDEGIIHFHDADYFAQNALHNCDLINLEDMLQNGTNINGVMIEKPHRFSTACNIATQIIAQVASNQYGGQSISLTHLAKFVDVSRKAITKDVLTENEEAGVSMNDEQVNAIVERRLRKEVKAGIQTIQYQVVTLMTTNGQAPFITVFLYLGEAGDDAQLKADLAMCIEETLQQRIIGVKNEAGVYITPAFPKLIYVLEEDNVRENTPFWYLTELAAKCTAKRMVPDYISEKKMLELKDDVYTCMGCRSFLTPDRFTEAGVGNIANAKNYVPGEKKYYGRFNQGVCTLNLAYVAMASSGDMDEFWRIFDESLELCHRALRLRHERLLGTPSDVAPILWQYGALARLKKGEKIDKLLYGGYSTISLGYAGLYEATKYLTGHSHTDPEGEPLALAIMQHMNDACAKWKAAENIDYSLYGTPLESTTYKFARALKAQFGVVKDVSDHDYITNSYHVNVREEIDAFSKLAFEAKFQALSPGGAISYVEVPDLKDNIPAVLAIMQFIYDNIMYAEVNSKSDYCQVCGFDGEIQIVEEDGKLLWECPHCHNRDQHKMNVARRTCGYIGTQFWNQGRTAEIKDRVLHVSVEENKL